MIEPGEDSGFSQKRLDVLRVVDSLGVWHLDGNRPIQVIVVSKIDPSEPALTYPIYDSVAADLGGVADRRGT
jgi:hypothetical protein